MRKAHGAIAYMRFMYGCIQAVGVPH